MCCQLESHPWLTQAFTQINSNQLCDHVPTTHTHTGSNFTMVAHSSRVLLKHIWFQTKELCKPEPFSRSFTSLLHRANTSSTQSLMLPEKRGSAWYLSLPKAGGKKEMAESMPANKPLTQEGYESLHPHSLSERAAETERCIIRYSSDLKYAFYYCWLTHNWAFGQSRGKRLDGGPKAGGKGGLLADS